MNRAGKPTLLKEVNSSMIERLIFKRGPLSKSELARTTKLSIPTVNKIVDELESQGCVCPVGLTSEGAGRKAMLYQTNKDSGCIIALYYYWGKYFCRLSDAAGNTLDEKLCLLDASSAETAMASTLSAIDGMSNKAPSVVRAIGIGVPGAVSIGGKLFGIPKIEVWEGFNLEEALSERYDADILIENDVKLSAAGYYLTHLSDDLDDMVYIYAGNGMNSGIIINKQLHRGATNFSGELGFMAPWDGEDARHDYTLEGGFLESKLNPALKRNKEDIKEALAGPFTAIAANYTAIINPAAIVFGGEAITEPLIDEIRRRLACYAPQHSIPRIIHDTNDNTGVTGLVLACVGKMTPVVQLVEYGGI